MGGSILSAPLEAKAAKQRLGAAEDQFERIEQERERGLALGNKLDWTPEMVSKALGSYQRSQSPVADAFIGSFLSGTNDQAIQSTRAGAPRAQAQAKQAFDQQYGGWDKIREQDAEMRKSQPWAIKDIGGVEKVDSSKGAFEASELGYLDTDQLGALKEQGFSVKDGKPDKQTKQWLDAWTQEKLDFTQRGGRGQQFLQALASYMQEGGAWRQLPADLKKKDGKYGVNIDEFIRQYRPAGQASLAKPAPGRVV